MTAINTLAAARTLLETKGREALIEALKAKGPLAPIRSVYAEAGLEPTKSPNKTFLARKIADAIETQIEADRKAAETAAQLAEDAAFADRAKRKDPTEGLTDEEIAEGYAKGTIPELKPRHLTVAHLTRAYEIAVGRTTGSTDRGYLIWKIREAKKGNITTGEIKRTRKGSGDQMVLPFRVDRETTPILDAAWKAAGFNSRMDFLRHAVAFTLSHTGNGIPAELADWLRTDETAADA